MSALYEIDLDSRYALVPILARQYLDAPARLYGRDPNTGIDCLGLVAMAATQAGFDCPNMLIRTPGPDGKRPPMMEAIEIDMKRVSLADVRAGDMLWLQPDMGRRWDHLAIISKTNPIEIIHTDPMAQDKVREHRLSDPVINCGIFRTPMVRWEGWVKGAFRFKKLKLDDSRGKIIAVSYPHGRKVQTEVRMAQ